ncbi:MAG: tRNA lysidine(34) synthetase TilS [Spirochaetales bacterium]|nr:tRNA lysidine(34) synthetase TilS [Spirochaetales bacterium]
MPSKPSRAVRERVERVVSAYLGKHVRGDGKLLVAASGGRDSTALLAACVAVSARGRLETVAMRVDHGIRPLEELAIEAAMLETTCRALGVRLLERRLARGEVADLAARMSCGIEAAARSLRRAALAETARLENASLILLGHTRDDQAETVLMRLFSGSGSGGLRGMRSRNGPWGRPLLSLPKDALTAYLMERGIPWTDDSTNDTLDYSRNRVRHILVPSLDAVFPGWRKALSRTAAKASIEDSALDALADGIEWSRTDTARSGAARSCTASLLTGTPLAVAARALARAADLTAETDARAESIRVPWGSLYAAAKGASSGRAFAVRGGGLRFASDARRVTVSTDRPDAAPDRQPCLVVRIEGPGSIVVGKREVLRIYWTDGGTDGLPEGSFSFPLTVRTRRQGDPRHPPGVFLPDPDGFPLLVAEDADGVACLVGTPAGRLDFPRNGRPAEGRRLVIAKGTDAHIWH